MRDLTQAEALGVDTSDMVVVTHPDKKARYGGGPAQFTMTRLAFVKRRLASKGYEIVGDATQAAPLTAREQSMLAELEQLRGQLADGRADAGPTDDPEVDRRASLEAEAASLELKVDKRWSEETLEKKISEARAVQNLDEDFDQP